MLVNILNNKPIGTVSISNTQKEQEFLTNNPTYIQTDFNFTESLDLYEHNGTTFTLVADWETIKAQKEADAEAQRLAEIEANKPTFEELKAQKIKELSTKYDANFNAYLSQYPKGEQDSFQDKALEAKAYMADNTASTPYISAMVGGDETKRIAMINAVWAKVQFIAQTEGQMIATRDAIKACTTQEELDAIQV